jgi:hypothetical protein
MLFQNIPANVLWISCPKNFTVLQGTYISFWDSLEAGNQPHAGDEIAVTHLEGRLWLYAS